MRGDIERIVHGFIDDLLAAGPVANLVSQFGWRALHGDFRFFWCQI